MRFNVIWFKIKHELFNIFQIIIRYRTKCPECKAIGTYLAHGGIIFSDSKESGRRYLCKWCGLYIGQPMGKGKIIKRRAFIDDTKGCWRIGEWYEELPDDAYTPQEKCKPANPWVR